MPTIILVILGLAFLSYIWSRIFEKAGYSRWWGLVMMAPLANVVALVIFAFSEWPVHTELRRLRN
ncbi:MAG: hypothetical protein HY533_04610 [Chloroflexi bacterium]|nr:hypothetical protein [Chloroflexota bacterium]